jgi:hypothetical protein
LRIPVAMRRRNGTDWPRKIVVYEGPGS